jgi:hypothetical protein
MYPFQFLLNKDPNPQSDRQSFAIVSGMTISDHQQDSKIIKAAIKIALVDWLHLPENKTRLENLDGDVSVNDLEILLDKDFERLLAKQQIYYLDIVILEADSNWGEPDNILD